MQKKDSAEKPAADKKDEAVKKVGDDITAPEDEKGGYKDSDLPEPTRFGDWEVKGRCSDF